MPTKLAPIVVGGALVAAGLAAFFVWRNGSVGGAARAVGSGTVDAVGGLAFGVVEGVGGLISDVATPVVSPVFATVGATVGLPKPSETTTDAEVARWIIDRAGWFAASKWSGAPALLKAMTMPAGSGKPPPPGSPAYVEFVTKAQLGGQAVESTPDYTGGPWGAW